MVSLGKLFRLCMFPRGNVTIMPKDGSWLAFQFLKPLLYQVDLFGEEALVCFQ
jgi:hypothetical protein